MRTYNRQPLDEDLDDLISGRNLRHTLNEETGEWESISEDGLSHSELVEQYNERTNRLNAISSVYQRANRIITGEDVTVKVIADKNMETNARSNGKDIELNSLLIENLTDESIISLHGVNYHELAHVMFSPRQGSNLGIYARDNKLLRAISILEESRSEQLLCNLYPAVRPFLEASTYTYLLAKPSQEWGGVFHLVTGRTYLPLELRQSITDKGVEAYGYDVVAEAHSCIHEYRNLVFPADFDKAKQLAHRLSKIVGLDDEPNGGAEGGKPKGGECEGMPTKGRPAIQKTQESLQEKSKGVPTEQIREPQPNKGESKDKSEAEKNEPQQTNAEPDVKKSDEAGKVAQAVNERMEQIKNDSSIKREIRDTRNSIIDSDVAKVSLRETSYQEVEPSHEAIVTAKRFSAELERLVRNSDPAWLSRTRSGRLNIQRTMNPDINSIAEAFDQWDIGNDATDIEAVILTDNSGSMGGQMRQACENAWIIKRAIESINGSVSAFNFESDTEIMYNAKDKAKPTLVRYVPARGNTNPMRGLIEAKRILSASKKPIKLLFIVTDGEWYSAEKCDPLIKGMGEQGVLTSVVFLGHAETYKNLVSRSVEGEARATEILKELRHEAKVFNAVASTKDVLRVATELVKSTLKRVG